MKAIIDGLRYDTDRAELIGETRRLVDLYADGRCDLGDVWEAGLYQTASGRWFLAGIGGYNTEFHDHLPDRIEEHQSKIVPLPSEDAAFEWAQTHLTAREVDKAFSKQIKDA
jgi:hypothetical protein